MSPTKDLDLVKERPRVCGPRSKNRVKFTGRGSRVPLWKEEGKKEGWGQCVKVM